jgi:hypothetical protein
MSDRSFSFSMVEPKTDIVIIKPANEPAVIRIDWEGRIFWREREVESDDDFRSAMLELRDYFMGKRP